MTPSAFLTSGLTNGRLRALADGEDGPNGAYRYSYEGSTFPTEGANGTNYWVDVRFSEDENK